MSGRDETDVAAWLAEVLADPRVYSETVQRLGREVARCPICAAGYGSEGDTQDVIDAHREHRARVAALRGEATT